MKSPITLVDYGQPEKYKEAKTEFVVFVNEGEKRTPGVYDALYQVYKDNPLFRKMSMVAPVLKTPLSLIYGWTISDNTMQPKYTPSSSEPYAIQVGSITHSVLRKAALDRIDYQFTGNRLEDSVNLSIAFWDCGQMCYIAPSVSVANSNALDTTFAAPDSPTAQKLFKREMIG